MRNSFLRMILASSSLILFFNARAMAQAAEVYVADFAVDSRAVADDADRGGPLEALKPGILRDMHEQRSEIDAGRLAQTLSGAVTDELGSRGISASRVSGIPDAEGVLVQGELVESGGSGETMQVRIGIDKLPLAAGASGEQFDLGATSGRKAPGGGGAVAMAARGSPYGLAAKFVLSKKAADKEVAQIASQIADRVQEYLGKK